MCEVGGKGWEAGGWRSGRRLGHLINPAVKLLKLLFRKEIFVALAEELVGPHMESHLIDPKFVLGLDKNPCDGEADLLAADACLVSFTICSSWVVTKTGMSGIVASMCDQIIQNFLFQGGPNGVSRHENIRDLGLGVLTGILGSPSDVAEKPSKKVSCMRKVCELFPVLHSHDIVRVWDEIVGHGAAHNHWKVVLLVVVRNKVSQAGEKSSGCERMRVQSKEQCVPQRVDPHHGESIVLHFAGVDLSSCGSSFDRFIGGLCRGCRFFNTTWLLETSTKSKPVCVDCK